MKKKAEKSIAVFMTNIKEHCSAELVVKTCISYKTPFRAYKYKNLSMQDAINITSDLNYPQNNVCML